MQRYKVINKILASSVLAALSTPAFAYLDPGTGSIIFQAIIASVVVGFASIRLWWDKFISLFRTRKNDPDDKLEVTDKKDILKADNKSKNN